VQIADSVLDLVGNTPLVRLRRVGAGLPCPVVVKLEATNPGGSVKDRPAVAMIDAAERDGRLAPGGTIVEVTSGNTGVGLAIVAAQRGYRCVFVSTKKAAPEKIALLRAYGAEVVVCPAGLPADDPRSANQTAARLVDEIPGAFRPDQYTNRANPASHEQGTGPELWAQTDGRITHLVATAGTGGTVSGTGGYLKQRNPRVEVVVADPRGSVFSGGAGTPYLVEGAGEDFWPDNYRRDVIDRTIAVSDRDSFLTARRLAREEGLLVGGSCGTAVHAALTVAAGCRPDDLVVAILPDSGRGYLSKVHDDAWMIENGFLDDPDVAGGRVGELPAAPLVCVPAQATARDALELLRAHGADALPVATVAEPIVATQIAGTVHEVTLSALEYGASCQLDAPVTDVMAAPPPFVGAGESGRRACAALAGSPVVIVLRDGAPVAVLTAGAVS
jgi:cystathionine beta-synthase